MTAGETRLRTPLFAGLDAAALGEVARQMTPRHFAPGEPLCREGEPGESLFVIRQGLARVVTQGASGTAGTIARLRPGDVVGEMALVTGEPRSATVTALVPTDALELRREDFALLLARYPVILANLNAILSRRLARTTARRERRGEALALLAGTPGAPLVPEILAAAAASSPRGVHLLAVGPPDGSTLLPGDARLTTRDSVTAALGLLDDLLATHGSVILVTEPGTPELPLLVEQLDRVVALVDADEAARLVDGAGPAAGRLELALVGDGAADRAPRLGEARVARRVARGPGRARDTAWLGRHLARTKLGLALGAGGAKGYAHIGALAALEQAGYTVDYVAGSSIGALIGAWLALGADAARLDTTMRAAFAPEQVEAMFKLATSGLASGLDVLARVCRETTGERSFDDLALPLVMLAVDLNTRRPTSIATGPLWEGLLAALAIVGVYPPYQRGAQRLVDAVTLVPVPTDAVDEAGADVTVAVNLLSRETLPSWPGAAPPAPPPASGRVRMLDTLMEVLELSQLDASVRHAARADVVITPRFGPGSWRDFHLADRFLAAGRAAARAQLPALAAFARSSGRPPG